MYSAIAKALSRDDIEILWSDFKHIGRRPAVAPCIFISSEGESNGVDVDDVVVDDDVIFLCRVIIPPSPSLHYHYHYHYTASEDPEAKVEYKSLLYAFLHFTKVLLV